MIFVPILLLNMLIAMMGNTYAHVIEQSEKEWMKQWAKIVVTLERAIPQADAQKYLEAYSIPLGPSDDSGFEQRGVMVIKSKSKTRAKQRKGAVSNWKRVGRVTLNALQKRGMTGEELRRIMWGRASITSPTKVSKKKPKDPYNTFFSNNVLETAVDVMAFAQDIVMGTGSPKKLYITKCPNSEPTNNEAFSNSTRKANTVVDPLRELVLMSEIAKPIDANFLTNIQLLANQASTLVQVVPVSESLDVKAKQQKLAKDASNHINLQTGTEITNLSSIFQDPCEIVNKEKEKDFLKKLEVLDDTEDSDGFIERPILGKISLVRRAKSAVARTTSVMNHNNKYPVYEYAWQNKSIFVNKQEQRANGSERKTANQEDTLEIKQEYSPTANDVRKKIAEFHLRRTQMNPIRNTRKRRNNKISPENTFVQSDVTPKRSKSAPDYRWKRDEYPPDPLEPWSTSELASINTILGS